MSAILILIKRECYLQYTELWGLFLKFLEEEMVVYGQVKIGTSGERLTVWIIYSWCWRWQNTAQVVNITTVGTCMYVCMWRTKTVVHYKYIIITLKTQIGGTKWTFIYAIWTWTFILLIEYTQVLIVFCDYFWWYIVVLPSVMYISFAGCENSCQWFICNMHVFIFIIY